MGIKVRGLHSLNYSKQLLINCHHEDKPFAVISSCTSDVQVVEAEGYLGKRRLRMLFTTKRINGASITNHSHYKDAEQILLQDFISFMRKKFRHRFLTLKITAQFYRLHQPNYYGYPTGFETLHPKQQFHVPT